jgi:hypothetical protein
VTTLVEYPGFKPVPSLYTNCRGCEFDYSPSDCAQVACFPDSFPRGHPLRHVLNIIWVSKEAT